MSLPLPVTAAEDIEGQWMLSLQDNKRTLVGLLEIESGRDGWVAYLDGGPAIVESDGDDVTIVADSRDVRGFVFDRRMTGKIDGDSMSGTYVQLGAAAQKEAPGPWHAVRHAAGERNCFATGLRRHFRHMDCDTGTRFSKIHDGVDAGGRAVAGILFALL